MQPLLIIGGGIGGLTHALSLAAHGVASIVFEARDAPPADGAGIQLGPNATRILKTLGLGASIEPHTASPERVIVRDGRSGRQLARLPLGRWITQRHGAPYWVIHRAALHETLWNAAVASPYIDLRLGYALTALCEDVDNGVVSADFANGQTATGPLLVGADGLWSQVRHSIDAEFTLRFSGLSAARAVIPMDQLGADLSPHDTGVWLSPRAHIVHYPIEAGRAVALVAIGASDAPPNTWASPVSRDVIAARFSQLPPALTHLLDAPQEWREWALMVGSGNGRWSRGRTILIGDAAHPILPFLAQGGAMAIEDGFELANAIAQRLDSDGVGSAHEGGTESDVADLLDAVSEMRRQRVQAVQNTSAENGRAYHLSGMAALARNAALRSLPGHLFMRRYDWIYGYKA